MTGILVVTHFDNHPHPRESGDRLRRGSHLIKNNGMLAFAGMMPVKLRHYRDFWLLSIMECLANFIAFFPVYSTVDWPSLSC